jgi:hypothetical protein
MNLRRSVFVTALAAVAPLAAAFPAAAASHVNTHATAHASSHAAWNTTNSSTNNSNPGITVVPPVARITADGTNHVSLVLLGTGLLPNETYTVSSSSLAVLCTTTVITGSTTTDINGNFNVTIQAAGCVPGTAVVEASETTSPYRTYFAPVRLTG